jgi:Family of unknown function (DUF5309)
MLPDPILLLIQEPIMATSYTSSAELKIVDYGGVIREDVLDELFNIDPIDLPFQDAIGRETSSNAFKSWVQENLAVANPANAAVEGAAATAPTAIVQNRIGNQHQISTKTVYVTDRARQSDTIGYADQFAHELMVKTKELKRDMEANMLGQQASVAMVTTGGTVDGTAGSSQAGVSAGAAAMIHDDNSNGATTGAFNGTVFAAVGSLTASRGLTEKLIRDLDEVIYAAGGEPSILMSTPKMIRGISEYLFTASARIATLMSDATNSTSKYGKQGTTAIGAVKIFTSDYSTLELVPNRFQQTYNNTSVNCDVYLFDPKYWAVSYLQGIQAKPLARLGTAERSQISVDYTLMCLSQKASGVICAINPATAVIAA